MTDNFSEIKPNRYRMSLIVALFVIFMDFMGFALVWPIFPPMLFDNSLPLLPVDTSVNVRGFLLGFLVSLAPLAQFFSSAVWGTVSDNWGRKKPLQLSLIVSCIGTLLAFIGVYLCNLWIILLSRILGGLASGNFSIVQAAIVDMSTPEEKTKNFGLFGMMVGLGFTLGPLMGGLFSSYSYSTPFLISAFLALLNLLAAYLFFQETLHYPTHKRIDWKIGISNLKRAFYLKELRIIFLTCFLAQAAWDFFLEFIPVYLMDRHQFMSGDLGLFFGVAGAVFAFNSGFIIRFVSKWVIPENLMFGAMLLSGFFILAIFLNSSLMWMWASVILTFSFGAYFSPACNTLISNQSAPEVQGEALGILGSIYGLATIISALFSGSFVGSYPTLSIWGGGLGMLATALIFFIGYPHFMLRRKMMRLFNR